MAKQHLKGLKIVLTGDFKSYTRREATKIFEELGADVTGAVSGKTKIIIAGKSPGSKLGKGKERGLSILDEAQMLLLMGGKTLKEVLGDSKEKEDSARQMPKALGFPKDGKFESFYKSTKQLKISGEFTDGLRDGSWKLFWPNGKIKQDYSWKKGLQEGPSLGWSEEGIQVLNGVHEAGVQKGMWTWHANNSICTQYYDENGKKHGDYSLHKGVQGAHWHGERDGKWEWLEAVENSSHRYKRIVRNYHRGQLAGESKAWYFNGKLAYKYNFPAGMQFVYYEDGTPKKKGEFVNGVKVGVHSTWDEQGKQTDTTYVQGVPETILTDKEIISLVKKLTKRDRSAELDLFDEFNRIERELIVYYLWKKGFYDLPKDPKLWYFFYSDLLSGEDILLLLKEPVKKDELPHCDVLNELVSRAYLRDPDPIDAAWLELPTHCKEGVALVRSLVGLPKRELLKRQIKSIADDHGDLEKTSLFDNKGMPAPLFDTFLSFFGPQDEWDSALKSLIMKKKFSPPSFNTFYTAIKNASVKEMIQYCDGSSVAQVVLSEMLLKVRNDDGATITEIALGMKSTDWQVVCVVCAAITRLNEEGNAVPQALLDSFKLETESPHNHKYASSWKPHYKYTRCWKTIEDQILSGLKFNFHFVADVINLKPGFVTPTCQPIHDALLKLTEEQRLSIFEQHLNEESEVMKLRVVPYLYLVDSPELWARTFEIAISGENDRDGLNGKPVSDTISWGFGELGLRFLPKLIEKVKREKRKAFKAPWQAAIVYALLRTVVDGEVFSEKYDSQIKLSLADPFLLEHLLYKLPAKRMEAILGKSTNFKHISLVFTLAALRPSDMFLRKVFEALLAKNKKLTWEDEKNLKMGFQRLPNAVDWMRWLLENGLSNRDVFYNALDGGDFEALETELQGGKEPADEIEKLVATATEDEKGECIYALRRLEDVNAFKDLNLIGGPPPGVGLERWPFFNGNKEEPMEHLFTLDLETMPVLQARHKHARTMSIFCYQPQNNEAYRMGSGWTKVLFSTQEEVDTGGQVPGDVQADVEARFEVVAIDVDLENEEIHNQVYSLNARVLGHEIWLQGEEYNGDFVMQFNEDFCHINLGDCGVMYVYGDGAFWQCH